MQLNIYYTNKRGVLKTNLLGHGIENDKITCIADTDECSDSSLNNCDAHATCENTPGTFTCACNTGYEGDETTTCTGILSEYNGSVLTLC